MKEEEEGEEEVSSRGRGRIGLREEGEEEVGPRGKGEDWVEGGGGCEGSRFKREGGGLG